MKITVSEDYVKDDSTNGSFYLNGKYIQLPCKASLLTDLGFEPDSRFSVLKAGGTDYSNKIIDDQGRYLYLLLMNNTDSDQAVEDCNVYEVEYNADDGKDYEILDFSIKGVKVGDSVSKAESILGTPSYTTEYKGAVDAQWDTAKKDSSIHVEYINNINSMRISVDKPDIDYVYAYDTGFGTLGKKTFEEDPQRVTTGDPVPIYRAIFSIPIIGVIILVTVFLIIGSIAGAILVIREQKHKYDMEILNTPIDEEDDD